MISGLRQGAFPTAATRPSNLPLAKAGPLKTYSSVQKSKETF